MGGREGRWFWMHSTAPAGCHAQEFKSAVLFFGEDDKVDADDFFATFEQLLEKMEESRRDLRAFKLKEEEEQRKREAAEEAKRVCAGRGGAQDAAWKFL